MSRYDDDDEVEIEGLNPAMRQFMPAAFGRQLEERNADELFEKARRVPLAPKPAKQDSDDSDDDGDDDDDEYPISHEVVMKAHSKAVSSVSLDSSGTRFITASHDYTLKYYDFPAMSTDHLHGFRSLEPSESHHIHSATFSRLNKGRNVLVVPAATQAKIYSRDGTEEVEFVKGDMYLRDMHNTKGHVAEITAGVWHPMDPNMCATASSDSTIRIWDVNSKRQHKEIMVHKSRTGKGGRSRMCCLAWTGGEQGGKSMIGSVALDGSLVVYGGEGPYTRPTMEVREAHLNETWTGNITFSSDGRLIVTRGSDRTIKLWDTRKLKTAVTTRTDFSVPTNNESNLIFSPKTSSILCGDSDGNLHVLSPATLRSEETHAICPGTSISTLTWHEKINQLLIGTHAGSVHILFSPATSEKGAKTILLNAPRKRHIDDDPSLTTDAAAISGDAILEPGQPRKRALDVRRPEMPQVTPWGKSQPDAEHIRKTHVLSSMRDEDPREALLKYAEKAEKDPMFTGVWKQNQPKTIYAEVEDEEEEAEAEKGPKRRRQ